MKSRISSPENPFSELYARILPISLQVTSKSKRSNGSKYRIFLQKGLQVMGKSQTIQAPQFQTASTFDLSKEENIFDMQLITQKNMVYEFVMYEVDENEREERIERVEYNMQDYYNSFIKKEQQQTEFDCKIQFKSLHFLFQCKLFIHNISEYITFITANLLKKQQQQPEEKLGPSELKLQSKEALNKIQQLPSEENYTSNIYPPSNERQQFVIKQFKTEEQPEQIKQPKQIKQIKQIKESKKEVSAKEEVKQGGKMKKIAIIVMIMLLVLGLMGSGIIPIGKKGKGKGKKKAKNKY